MSYCSPASTQSGSVNDQLSFSSIRGSRIEDGNALGLYGGACTHDDDDPLGSHPYGDSDNAAIHVLDSYANPPSSTMMTATSSLSSLLAGAGERSYLPTPNVGDYPLPPVTYDGFEKQPSYELYSAWDVQPSEARLYLMPPVGHSSHSAMAAAEGFNCPQPTSSHELPSIPAITGRQRRLGLNQIPLPNTGDDYSTAWPSPSVEHQGYTPLGERGASEYSFPTKQRHSPSTAQSLMTPAAEGDHGVSEQLGQQAWTPPVEECEAIQSYAPDAPPYLMYCPAQSTNDIPHGLGIRLDPCMTASSSSPDVFGGPDHPRLMASEAQSTGINPANERKGGVGCLSTPMHKYADITGGTWYTYPSYSTYSHPPYESSTHLSVTTMTGGSRGTVTTQPSLMPTVLSLLPSQSPAKQNDSREKPSHPCDPCRVAKQKCDGEAPAGGLGLAVRLCRLCEKRGHICSFTPAGIRGKNKNKNKSKALRKPTTSAVTAAAIAAYSHRLISSSLSPFMQTLSPAPNAAGGTTSSLGADGASTNRAIQPPQSTAKAEVNRAASLRSVRSRTTAAYVRRMAAPYAKEGDEDRL